MSKQEAFAQTKVVHWSLREVMVAVAALLSSVPEQTPR